MVNCVSATEDNNNETYTNDENIDNNIINDNDIPSVDEKTYDVTSERTLTKSIKDTPHSQDYSTKTATDEKEQTNIYMYTRSGDTKDTTIKVSGKLQTNGNALKGEIIKITVNKDSYTAKSGGYGYFTVNHTITSYDDLNVTFTYAGNDRYSSSTNSTVYTVKKPTNLFMYTRSGDTKGSTIKVSGKLQYNNGEGVKGEKITIKVNDKTYTATTGGYGYFTVNHTITSYDDLNVTFTYAGSSKYLSSKNSTIYTVKKPTNLFMYTRSGDTKGNTIKVSGKLQYNNGEGVKGEKITIKVNNKTYTTTTGGYGYFTVNHTITSYDDLNVTFTYKGSSKYISSKNSTIYTVKKPTNLYMYTIYNTNVGKTIKISGKLQYNGEGVKGETVTIDVDGKKYTATTGGYGYFTINYTVDSYKNHTVTFTYKGDKNYLASTNTTTFVVKQDTNIYMYPRTSAKYGSTIKVSGKLLSNGEGVKGQNIKITINGKSYTAKTVGYGYFTINYTIDSMDKQKVTFKYPGNSLYESSSNSSTFTVEKQDVKVIYDGLDGTKEGAKIKVNGTLQDKSANVIANSKLNVTINGKKYSVKTDANGMFSVVGQAGVLGKNNITFQYGGSKYYNSYKLSKTFIVSEKTDPDIRLSGSEIHPGTSKTFFALLPYDATGTVRFKINDDYISDNLTVQYGQVLYSYVIPETYYMEKYTLYLMYSGDDEYQPKTMNVTLTLTPDGGKSNVSMNMSNFTIKYSTTGNITAYLNDNAFGIVQFEINNTDVSEKVNVTYGVATWNYLANLTPGNYKVIASFGGNYMYYPFTVNSTLTISKANSSITVKGMENKAGNTTWFEANTTDEFGNPINEMNITFSLNDMVIGSNLTNRYGVAKLNYTIPSTLYNKTYDIIATSSPTPTVMGSTGQATLKLLQLKTKTVVPNISTIPAKSITITASIVDEFNNSVPKGKVTFKKDNVTIVTVDVDNGYAKYQYETNYETTPLSYISADYVGDWKYDNSNGTGTYKVTKLGTTISASSIDAKPNSDILFSARITDETQNHVTEGNVTFTLAGKVLGTVEVSKGNARLRFNLDSYGVGEYRIKCDYHGSKIYKESSNTNTLTVKRYETTIKGSPINAVVGNTTTITLNIMDEEKYNVNEGIVNYYVNNEFIGSANVSNGVSSIEYLVPNKYDGKIVKYYATYVKNDIYESSSYTDTLTVSHQKIVYVSPSGSDSNLGDEAHPFKTIEHAINHITLFGTVYLAPGTYSASGIELNSSINIIGSGMDKTIIDGKNSGKPVFNISKRNVVLGIDGITIKNGKSNLEFSAGAIVTSGKLNLANSRFVNNTGSGNYSGGAIYTNGILNVTNCKFENNKVTNINSQGGAIRTYNNITYIINCTFDSNKVTGSNTTGGSVIFGDSSDIIINGTTFTKNSVTGTYVTGGVIRTVYGDIVIDNSTFKNNNVKATYFATGGVIGSIGTGISILNSEFTSNVLNSTNNGGGSVIYTESAALDIKNSKLNSNKVYGKEAYGGVLYAFKAVVTLISNEINNNTLTATDNGLGGAVYINYGNMSVEKTKFAGNIIKAKEVALAGAIYSNSNVTIETSSFENNNINASNLGGGAIASMGNLTVSQTNFINNYAYNAGNAITSTSTAKNDIEDNYWNSNSPSWDNLLNGLSKPDSYSKTKFNV